MEEKLDKVEKQIETLAAVVEDLKVKLENRGTEEDSSRSRDETVSVDPIATGAPDSRNRAQLESSPFVSPIDINAADAQRDFDRIRDSLQRVPVPAYLKVNDAASGIKQECKGALKVVSKCARYAETGLKLISQIPEDNIQREDIENIFTIFAAQVQFLQSEYASLVVRSTFNEETSRIFRSFETNATSFSASALQNVRLAAELSAAQSRLGNTPQSAYRGRGRRGRNSYAGASQFWGRGLHPQTRRDTDTTPFPYQRHNQEQ